MVAAPERGLPAGAAVHQETRHFHEATGTTSPGRSKEEAEDYRYFAEPDLMPIAPSREWVEELRATLPEPPAEHRARLQEQWGFSDVDFGNIEAAGALALVEATVEAGASPGAARKWWVTELARRANEAGVELEELAITPAQVAAVQGLVDAGKVNDKLARQVIEGVLAGEGEPAEVVAARAAAFLLIVFQRLRHARVDDIANVRFIDAHTEGDRGADDVDLVAHEALVGFGAHVGVETCVIRCGAVALGAFNRCPKSWPSWAARSSSAWRPNLTPPST